MKRLPLISILVSCLSVPVFATVTIDYVSVGDVGNAADSTGYGAVAYEYQIGKYEVTNAQYAGFLNAKAATDPYGLYEVNMADYGITRSGSSGSYTYTVTAGFANKPVVYVSWFDAARFSNWLSNGQENGDTETGSYDLNGASSGIIMAVAGAKVRIPTENEWYKAAYYNGITTTYSLYANGQDTIRPTDANYGWNVGSLSNVGSYAGVASAYGTFDQTGNVWELNDAVISGTSRGLRGGSWDGIGGDSGLASLSRIATPPAFGEYLSFGFRLVNMASVPEPSSVVLVMLASGALGIRRRRLTRSHAGR